MILALAIASAGALIASAAGTAFLRRHALEWGLVDVPNERSLHTRVMPRAGGIVIVLSVLVGLALLSVAGLVSSISAAVFALSALVVAMVGWLDDRSSLSPQWRLLVHFTAACLAVTCWGAFDVLMMPDGRQVELPWPLAAAATIVWIVGLLNAYNFMDGIDGLAASAGVVGGLLWAWLGREVPLVSGAGALIAGASAGFLWHNWSPARIFMGDAGSGFLGFAFAVLPLMAFNATGDAHIPVAACVGMAPFLFDTALTFTRRLARRENVLRAHRSHLYQRLVLSGWPHRRVACVYVALGLACGAGAAVWMRGGTALVLLPPIGAVLSVPLVVWLSERRHSRDELQSKQIRVE